MNHLFHLGALLMTASAIAGCGQPDSATADLVLLEARIFTADEDRPWVQALAVKDGLILKVGTEDEISPLIGDRTEVIRLPGSLAVPGFNDAHVHMVEGGESIIGIQLRDAPDERDFRDRIAAYVQELPRGTWVLYGNWDHEAYPSKRHPTKELIDPVTPDHPVFVTRLDGHISLANTLALELAGITRGTPDPEGGTIVRDPATGEASGILIDAAQTRVTRVIPESDDSAIRRALEAAIAHAAELGVTSVQDNTDSQIFRVYGQIRSEGKLTVRVSAWHPIARQAELVELGIQGPSGDIWLRRGTVKIFADGSMGAGSALFFEPYTDDPSTSGLAMASEEELHRLIREADALGFDIACHAIGDRANAVILDAFAEAFRVNSDRQNQRRHRIEHAQVVRDEDVRRFRELDIIASIQPSHAIDDMRWAEKRIGRERCRNSYRVGSFINSGIHTAFGTDWFVEPLDPRLGLYAAVTREFPEGGPEGGWFPEERITLEQAITAYTMGSAFAEGMEDIKGKLAEGYLADISVFEKDLFVLEPQEWLTTPVILTVVGGNIVYNKQ